MKSARVLRRALGEIPGALVDYEPEHAERGTEDGARQSLWDPEGGDERATQRLEPDLDDDEDPGQDPSSLEELVEFAPLNEQDLVQALGGKAHIHEVLRSKLLTKGVEGLAWYVSFHATGVQWGIYVPISGLLFTALGAFDALSCDVLTKLVLAFRLIHQHELFHFAVDYACAQLEVTSGRPVREPARRSARGPGGYVIDEERLANAWMLRSLWRGMARWRLKGRSEAARDFVRMQPEGYRDAPEVTRSRFFSQVDDLIRGYAGKHSGAVPVQLLDGIDGVGLLPFQPYLDWRQCPVHVVHDEKRFNIPLVDLDLLRFVREIMETEAFQKDLLKLDPEIQRAWPKTVEKMRHDLTLRGLDFKPFNDRGERVFSVRVNRAYRAHLRHVPSTSETLEAFRVGDHKSTGHG